MGYMLLPFSHGIDNAAIEQAVTLAHEHNTTLVPLSLICLSGQKQTARLEHIQQSQDFLTLIQQKATRLHVPVKPLERYTCEEIATIQHVALELQCTGILLFARQQKGVLLSSATVQQLMLNHKRPCFLSSLPSARSAILRPQWPFKKQKASTQPAYPLAAFAHMRSVVDF
jgi:hypothetical protein